MSFLACSNCHEVMIKSMDNAVKVRSKVILVQDDITLAICKGCGAEIPVPLRFDQTLMKSMGPRLYLKS